MRDWRVMIVEDDEAVAWLHQRLVDHTPPFRAVSVVRSAEQAVEAYARSRPDLLLLDLTMPGAGGVTLLRRLRGAGVPVEAIAVTASRDAETVRTMLQLGVIDYLVKPFPPERLRQSLATFLHRASGTSSGELAQEQVDALSSAGRDRTRWLPKGLSASRLATIRRAMAAAGRPMTAEQVAKATGIARVTARRYLEYMTATRTATYVLAGSGAGRPRKLYEITVDTDSGHSG